MSIESAVAVAAGSHKKTVLPVNGFEFGETRRMVVLLVLLIVLIAGSALVMTLGAYSVSPGQTFRVILAHISPFIDISEVGNLYNTIIWNLRVPRRRTCG